MTTPMTIKRLPTGVPGLDAVLGGGLPEFSFNLIAGQPGTGKTTLAHQLMFALASEARPALYFTVLGESPLKMMRYQQQFAFYDAARINTSVRFVSLAGELGTGDYEKLLGRIMQEVQDHAPGLVFVDSVRSLIGGIGGSHADEFAHRLGMQLSNWQITSFLIGDLPPEGGNTSTLTVADGILALSQSVFRNSVVRKLQIPKMRGQATCPGIHSFRITEAGIEVYPSAVSPADDGSAQPSQKSIHLRRRLSMGVPGLDEMLGGGLPAGYSLLVAGPSGSGKTILATAFLEEGARRGEPGVMVAFEQTPSQSWTRTIDDLVRAGKIGLINTRLPDLSIDEIAQRLSDAIRRLKARRVVLDSLSGFELAVAPAFREDFKESLFRMVSQLSGMEVTVLMTSELEDRYTDLRFSSYGSAFLTDAIIVQRYVEIGSRLRRVMAVVKVRGSDHSDQLRQYEITGSGIIIGKRLAEVEGLLGGQPAHREGNAPEALGTEAETW